MVGCATSASADVVLEAAAAVALISAVVARVAHVVVTWLLRETLSDLRYWERHTVRALAANSIDVASTVKTGLKAKMAAP